MPQPTEYVPLHICAKISNEYAQIHKIRKEKYFMQNMQKDALSTLLLSKRRSGAPLVSLIRIGMADSVDSTPLSAASGIQLSDC